MLQSNMMESLSAAENAMNMKSKIALKFQIFLKQSENVTRVVLQIILAMTVQFIQQIKYSQMSQQVQMKVHLDKQRTKLNLNLKLCNSRCRKHYFPVQKQKKRK